MNTPSDFWDQRYGEDGYAYGESPNDFVASVADRIPPGPVLCLAEGEGRNAAFLAGRGHEVTAVDQSSVGLAKARALAESRGLTVRTVHADLDGFAIEPGAWAGIVATFVHLPPPLRGRVHRAAVEGLRPGGVFVLEAYTVEQLAHGTGGPPVAELLFGLDELRQELEGLVLEHAVEIVRPIEEGRYHRGTSAVVQVLGRKPGGRESAIRMLRPPPG